MSGGIVKNSRRKIFFSLALFIIAAFQGYGQIVELNLRLDRDTIRIGERTTIRLEIVRHQQVLLRVFPLRDSLNQEFEIIDSLVTVTADSLRQSYLITSFKPGRYSFSRIPLAFVFEGKTDTIFSPELLLTVISPEIDSKADIRDIKPPMNLPFRLREIIPETGIAIGILLILTLLTIFIIRRLRKKKILEEAEKSLPPHVIAFRELDRIKEEKLWQKGRMKEYYSRLSDTMRVYLEKRFNIRAMEYVSSETMQSFRKFMPHEELLGEMLEGILQTADMVKFAKEDPLPAVNQGNLDNAYLFIGQTKIEEIISLDDKTSETDNLNVNVKTGKE
jgi:hypothetical protein